MGTKTGELRETLMSAIAAVSDGKLEPARATAIAKLAAQINLSMEVEFNARLQLLKNGGAPSVGALPIGEEGQIVEEAPRAASQLQIAAAPTDPPPAREDASTTHLLSDEEPTRDEEARRQAWARTIGAIA